MKSLKLMTATLAIGSLAFGGVAGQPVERLGTSWQKGGFQSWLEKDNALITPESSNLAVQYCLRTTQEQLDGKAYDDVAKPMLAELAKLAKKAPTNDTEKGLVELHGLLAKINAIKPAGEFASPQAYEAACTKTVTDALGKARDLFTLYEGRMNPKHAAEMPEETRKKLQELAKRGVRVGPLKVPGLIQQICKLEGYYSTSFDQRLWKLFSTTRAMANVLPSDERNEEFITTMGKQKRLADLIAVLNRYSAVAGKPNGLSIGMNEEEQRVTKEATPVRMTGPALGSNTTALMAFYTTAWREQLQDHVLQAEYPKKPFQLISADQVLKATGKTFVELGELKEGSRAPSQTEEGMRAVWTTIFDFHVVHAKPPTKIYGENTAAYLNTSGLAWLALNAETNIRQNEKIAGLERAAAIDQPGPATRNVYANEEAYKAIEAELAAAAHAYSYIDRDGELLKGTCLTPVTSFVKAAKTASAGKLDKVVQLAANDTAFLTSVEFKTAFEFKPVIADIGVELRDDPEGFLGKTDFKEFVGQKDFNLHLATGYWREVPVKVDGKAWLAGTPSAFVVHFKDTVSTREWQDEHVGKYDR